MVSVICFLVIVALVPFALTRRRIYVICGFYCFFALLTVLSEGNVPRLGPVTVYRALYLVLAISMLARLLQDRTFLLRSRRWPRAPYVLLLVLLLASSLYSHSSTVFILENPAGLWNWIVVFLLFWIAAAHVH